MHGVSNMHAITVFSLQYLNNSRAIGTSCRLFVCHGCIVAKLYRRREKLFTGIISHVC